MMAINEFEHGILLFIQNNLRCGFLTPIMTTLSRMGDAGIFWIALTVVLLIFRRTRRVGMACAISIIISFTTSNIILKPLIARTRPYDLFQDLSILVHSEHDLSFPSGHATNAFATAWVLFRRSRKCDGIPALIIAIAISLSRLYVGVHYPTDVIAGTIVGIVSASIAIPLVKKLCKKSKKFKKFTSPKGGLF